MMGSSSLHSQSNGENTLTGQCHDINVAVNSCPINPEQKQGWNLIINETFGTGKENRWNRSANWDDNGCFRDYTSNPSNVTWEQVLPPSSDGGPNIPPPSIQKFNAKIWNTNFAVPNSGCPYSKGEMKTLSVLDSMFKSYYFNGPGYVEAKLRLTANVGQGASMWLWAVPDPDSYLTCHPANPLYEKQEIDVFETRSGSREEYDATYHWKTEDFIDRRESHTIILENHQFTDWTVFAIEWDETKIVWYVNNTIVHQLDMNAFPAPSCNMNGIPYTPPLAPMCLRFGTGSNTVGNYIPAHPSEMPTNIEIEYVRVYQKVGFKASPIKTLTSCTTEHQMCISENSPSTSDMVLFVNYYPKALYTWTSNYFDIETFKFLNTSIAPHQYFNKYKIWCKPNSQQGWGSIQVQTSFPDGYIEQDTLWIQLISAPPPKPYDDFFPVQYDGLCRYYVSHFNYDPTILNAKWGSDPSNLTNNAEIIYCNGVPVESHLHKYWLPNQYVTISYQDFNDCGGSEIRTTTIFLPPILEDLPCQW